MEFNVNNFFSTLFFDPEKAKPEDRKKSRDLTIFLSCISLGIVPLTVGFCWSMSWLAKSLSGSTKKTAEIAEKKLTNLPPMGAANAQFAAQPNPVQSLNGIPSSVVNALLNATPPLPGFENIKLRQLENNLRLIPVVDQRKVSNGEVSCGIHSWKNALATLALSLDPSMKDDWMGILEDKDFFDEANQFFALFSDTSQDIPLTDINQAFTRLFSSNENLDKFPNLKFLAQMLRENQDQISILEVACKGESLDALDKDLKDIKWEENAITCGFSPALLNNISGAVKAMDQPGPYTHVFITGQGGHWINLVMHKDENNHLNWYVADSLNNATKAAPGHLVPLQLLQSDLGFRQKVIKDAYGEAAGNNLKRLASNLEKPKMQLAGDADNVLEIIKQIRYGNQFFKDLGIEENPEFAEDLKNLQLATNFINDYLGMLPEATNCDQFFQEYPIYGPFKKDRFCEETFSSPLLENLPKAFAICSMEFTDLDQINALPNSVEEAEKIYRPYFEKYGQKLAERLFNGGLIPKIGRTEENLKNFSQKLNGEGLKNAIKEIDEERFNDYLTTHNISRSSLSSHYLPDAVKEVKLQIFEKYHNEIQTVIKQDQALVIKKLIEPKDILFLSKEEKNQAFLIAINEGSEEKALKLLGDEEIEATREAFVNARSQQMPTLAVRLIEKGVPFSRTDFNFALRDNRTALALAMVDSGRLDLNGTVNTTNEENTCAATPLFSACLSGNPEVVKKILQNNKGQANKEIVFKSGNETWKETPVHYFRENDAIVEVLLNPNGDPNRGEFLAAIKEGNEEKALQLLNEEKIEISHDILLHVIGKQLNSLAVKLIERGATFFTRDFENALRGKQTALAIAMLASGESGRFSLDKTFDVTIHDGMDDITCQASFLFLACQYDNPEVVNKILQNNKGRANQEILFKRGNETWKETPVHYFRQNAAIVEALLAAGANPNQGAFLAALNEGDEEKALKLLDDGGIEFNRGTLQNAIKKQMNSLAVKLIEKGVLFFQSDFETSLRDKQTALAIAMVESGKLNLDRTIKTTVQKGFEDITCNATPLFYACWFDNTEVVKKILQKNKGLANKEITFNFGSQIWKETFLSYFCENVPLVEALLTSGAHPNDGVTLKKVLNSTKINEPTRLDIVSLLFEHGADVNERPSPSIQIIVKEGFEKILAQLIKKGTDLNHIFLTKLDYINPRRTVNALLAACLEGKKEGIQLLLEGGADPFMMPDGEKTPLLASLEKGNLTEEILALFLNDRSTPDIYSLLSPLNGNFTKERLTQILPQCLQEIPKEEAFELFLLLGERELFEAEINKLNPTEQAAIREALHSHYPKLERFQYPLYQIDKTHFDKGAVVKKVTPTFLPDSTLNLMEEECRLQSERDAECKQLFAKLMENVDPSTVGLPNIKKAIDSTFEENEKEKLNLFFKELIERKSFDEEEVQIRTLYTLNEELLSEKLEQRNNLVGSNGLKNRILNNVKFAGMQQANIAPEKWYKEAFCPYFYHVLADNRFGDPTSDPASKASILRDLADFHDKCTTAWEEGIEQLYDLRPIIREGEITVKATLEDRLFQWMRRLRGEIIEKQMHREIGYNVHEINYLNDTLSGPLALRIEKSNDPFAIESGLNCQNALSPKSALEQFSYHYSLPKIINELTTFLNEAPKTDELAFSSDEIEGLLKSLAVNYKKQEYEKLLAKVAKMQEEGKSDSDISKFLESYHIFWGVLTAPELKDKLAQQLLITQSRLTNVKRQLEKINNPLLQKQADQLQEEVDAKTEAIQILSSAGTEENQLAEVYAKFKDIIKPPKPLNEVLTQQELMNARQSSFQDLVMDQEGKYTSKAAELILLSFGAIHSI